MVQEYFDYSGFEEISPEIIEKKQIRRLGFACGIGLIALFVVMYFWANVYLRIAVILGLPVKNALEFANDPFLSNIFHIVISAIMIVLPFFVVSKAMGIKFGKDIPFKAAKKGYFLPSVMLGIGFCLFSSIATNYGSRIFTFFGIEFPSSSSTLPQGVLGILINIIATAFFPAFLEELTMRGMVMGMLRKKGDGFAIVCSAFIFGIMHANFEQIVFAFFVGLILGYITVKSGSIWPAIVVHFLNNLISVAFSYLTGLDNLITSVLFTAIFVLLTVFAVMGLNKLQKIDTDYLKMPSDGEISPIKKTVWFLTSPVIIISILISILIAFMR